MATSGSINFNETRNEIIQDALDILNVVDASGAVPASDQTRAERTLNQLVKAWQAEGIKLWNKKEAVVFLQDAQASYVIGATDHTSLVGDYGTTTTSAAAISGATSIVITALTNFAISDNIGIELDSGTRQWTTITNIVGSTITLNNALTGAVASGNTVVAYTTKLDRVQQITNARVLDLTTNNERVTNMIAYKDYYEIPQKTAAGVPNQYMYDRGIISTGTLYVWPVPDGVKNILRITIAQSIEDFDAATDNADFPQEWLLALSYSLAVALAPVYGKYTELSSLMPMADRYKQNVMWYDNEIASMTIEPDFSR